MLKNDSTLAAYLGSIAAFLGGLTLDEWGALIGIVLGVLTFFINWHYKCKIFHIEEQEFKRHHHKETDQ